MGEVRDWSEGKGWVTDREGRDDRGKDGKGDALEGKGEEKVSDSVGGKRRERVDDVRKR